MITISFSVVAALFGIVALTTGVWLAIALAIAIVFFWGKDEGLYYGALAATLIVAAGWALFILNQYEIVLFAP